MGSAWGSVGNLFGVGLGLVWDRFEIYLGSIWDRVRDRFGIDLDRKPTEIDTHVIPTLGYRP